MWVRLTDLLEFSLQTALLSQSNVIRSTCPDGNAAQAEA
jgi:hypothetical protein